MFKGGGLGCRKTNAKHSAAPPASKEAERSSNLVLLVLLVGVGGTLVTITGMVVTGTGSGSKSAS